MTFGWWKRRRSEKDGEPRVSNGAANRREAHAARRGDLGIELFGWPLSAHDRPPADERKASEPAGPEPESDSDPE